MGDLLELFRKRQDLPHEQIISVWLGATSDQTGDEEVRAVLQDLVSEAFAHPGQEEQPVIHITLPSAPSARRQSQRLLAPLGFDGRSGEATISPTKVIRYVEEVHGVPLMRVDAAKKELWIGIRGNIERIDAPVEAPEEVREALANVEAYIETVDLGQCLDPLFTKTSMYEALLYLMAAPFANEQMREMRRRYALVNKRGPRFLYIYGPAQNGKTTFLRYGLKLITGNLIEPLPAPWFTKRRVRGVEAIGTCFPLMFDDMTSTTSKTFEDISKEHWETSWSEDSVFPQLIFTSNNIALKDWAKSRMKRVDFDVHFVPNTATQGKLARILEKPNPVFKWFAHHYLEHLQAVDWLRDDELATAREVMKGLYDIAGQNPPNYFPTRPLEELYDPDLRVWKEIVSRRMATIRKERDRTIVVFSDDLEHAEIREFQAALPQTVKCKRIGKTLTIENPQYFHSWLESGTGRRHWWQRLVT